MNKNLAVLVVGLVLLTSSAYAARLPTVADDLNNWGTILNDYLLFSLGQNGTNISIVIDAQWNKNNASSYGAEAGYNLSLYNLSQFRNDLGALGSGNCSVSESCDSPTYDTELDNTTIIRTHNTTWASQFGNVTDNNQISNNAGYITTASLTDYQKIANAFAATNFSILYYAIDSRWDLTNYTAQNVSVTAALALKNESLTSLGQFNDDIGATDHMTETDWLNNYTKYNLTCIQITGSADLCDGSDAIGAGGASKTTNGFYLYNDTIYIYFNETMLNATIVYLYANLDAWDLTNYTAQNNSVTNAIALKQDVASAFKTANETDHIYESVKSNYATHTNINSNITYHEINFKHGNTTDEIRSQFTGTANISITNGAIDIVVSNIKTYFDTVYQTIGAYLTSSEIEGHWLNNYTFYNTSITNGLGLKQNEASAFKLDNQTYAQESDLTAVLDDNYCALSTQYTATNFTEDYYAIASRWDWANNASGINTSVTLALTLKQDIASAYKTGNLTIDYPNLDIDSTDDLNLPALDNSTVIRTHNTTWASQYGNVTDNSQIANGAGYITGYTETDPIFSPLNTSIIFSWNTTYVTSKSVGGEVTGTVGDITLSNTALNDQYVQLESQYSTTNFTSNVGDANLIANHTNYWNLSGTLIFNNGTHICFGTC